MTTRTGRPPRLSREQIVAAARALVEARGVDALTMRRLATDLGATPMAIYHHVRDREQLLLLLLDDVAAGMQRPHLPADPRERLVTTARAMHDTLAQVPWIVEILTADDLLSPAALWYTETIIDSAVNCGLTLDDAVHTYRSIWYYTAGEILVHAAAAHRRATDERPTFRDQLIAGVDPQAMPRLAAVADRWQELTVTDTYEQGLRALVDGLLTKGVRPTG
ncbi:TetR/AcrR family transcriptional regulator [Nocardia sp. CDC160]|uniref:TetR/AcrR family transcriptional regulator n=1 Tax=Nocardia sp. CDC160 TaxID=3112166 RepID=UPI002DBE594E|nr:TetR/AcrR family transcriptional regulator [Nocardia sp. CDC160]MEC3917622.1 TetR/AcrR family transcriptional regulator [Nocardia sp. CDC160]